MKQVLPLDGFVYWVNAAIVNDAEKERLGIVDLPITRTIPGSLHRQVVSEQSETASRALNNIIFTPLEASDNFNTDPNTMYLGEYAGVQFTFSRMESRYTQAGIFHYRGTAVVSTMKTQIIDRPEDIDTDLILSNSTPIWLSLKKFASVYPSFLSPSNLKPPYIVADVKNTVALQSAAHYATRNQHVQDSVRVTLYGFNNARALDFVDYVVNTALEGEEFGITNIPVISDGKYSQTEIHALAKLKYIDFDINYYQATARDIALQLITEAFIKYEVV
ncbi:hypothetical protein [Citrobacter werkmanii]|uniref:hypothetical protein n=1 Tax=Citrobacter werkmanii TaxID=67827 RepID=UPI00300D34E0